MTIRNDLSASKQKVLFVAYTSIFAVGAVGSFFPEYLHPQWLTIGVGALGLLLLAWQAVANHHYLWVLVEGEKLKLRYYSMYTFLRKYQAIEIPLASFRGYELRSSYGGVGRQLVLFQQVKNQRASYPPVPISTLSHKEYNALLALLNKYSHAN